MQNAYEKLRDASDVPVEKVMQNISVICADDNRDTLNLMAYKCKEYGWAGSYADTALGIIDLINESPVEFDAIVADINFDTPTGPGVTGLTVARTIRKVRPDVPIIFVSGYVNTIIREEVRRVNAEVIPKPVDFDTLFERIASLIYWHRLSYENYSGKDRRKSSINRTDWARRSSDRPLAPSQRLIDIISEVHDADG